MPDFPVLAIAPPSRLQVATLPILLHAILLTGLLCAVAQAYAAQTSDPAGMRALRIEADAALRIDGVPDDAVWQRAPEFDAFHKHARRDDGVTPLAAWNDRQIHRSLVYRYQWRHGRIVSRGVVDDKLPLVDERSQSLAFKLQWEVRGAEDDVRAARTAAR